MAAVGFGVQCQGDGEVAVAPGGAVSAHRRAAALTSSIVATPDTVTHRWPDRSGVDLAALARSDPEAFVRYCREAYDRASVRDYTCRFIKQEHVRNRLRPVEEVAVRFREEPYSVDMQWLVNAAEAQRALYVRDAWVDSRGQQLAWIKPAGALIKLVVPKIKQPIHGARAKAAARRSMNQFGFRNTMDLIIKYIERGRRSDSFRLAFTGEGEIDGRATWTFERRLPFDGDEDPYPDALLRYHIDQEWLVPTACFSYADPEGKRLLGSYILADVTFNVGLGDKDFDPVHLRF